MDCLAGDREVRSWDYQKGMAEKAEAERKARAQRDNLARPTYCKSDRGEVPYTAASGVCNSGDMTIDKAEYDELRNQSRASLLIVPNIDDKNENDADEGIAKPAKPLAVSQQGQDNGRAAVPPVVTLPQADGNQKSPDLFCLVIGSTEVFATRAQECPTGSTEISADAYSDGNIVSESDAMEVISRIAGE
jgi:hypothetical protein